MSDLSTIVISDSERAEQCKHERMTRPKARIRGFVICVRAQIVAPILFAESVGSRREGTDGSGCGAEPEGLTAPLPSRNDGGRRPLLVLLMVSKCFRLSSSWVVHIA